MDYFLLDNTWWFPNMAISENIFSTWHMTALAILEWRSHMQPWEMISTGWIWGRTCCMGTSPHAKTANIIKAPHTNQQSHCTPYLSPTIDSIPLQLISSPHWHLMMATTMTDRLGADIQIVPCKTNMTAEEFMSVFFNQWYCKNRCLSEIISNWYKLFISKFWHVLMKLTRIKHKLMTAYYPQIDSASESSNKTVIQCLWFHVEWNQHGWAHALPKVRFHMMNTINASAGLTPFI